jgi:PAS domain S-box-containing protein
VTNSRLRRYGIATLAVAISLLLRLLLNSLLVQQAPFLLFLIAVVFSTWYGGRGTGLFALLLSVVVSDFFFVAPAYSHRQDQPGELIELALFVVESGTVVLLLTALQAAKRQAEESTRNAQSHYQRLRESEERFRLLVEDVKDYAIFMLDRDGRFTSWNVGAERILGYSEAEILGRSFSCIYTEADLESGRPAFALQHAVAEGQTQDDLWHVRKDGSLFWANGVITPLRDEAGNLQGFSKILRDNTKSKQAQDALQASEERFRSLVEDVQDYAIFMLEPDGRVASWNIGAERILGYTSSEIIGQDYAHFFPANAVAEGIPEQELQVAIAEGRSQQERWHLRKNGTRFWATEVVTALRDSTGTLRGFSKVMRDITDRKRAEEERAQLLIREQAARAEAEAASRSKDEFLSILSHELRTPLAAILLWAELLRAGGLNNATTQQALETIERNAKSQSRLIEDLLDISRIITDNLRLNLQLVELAPIIQAAVDSLALTAGAKGLNLHLDLTAKIGLVMSDPQRLQQVVSNLLSNAIKFTPSGGQIHIQLERRAVQAAIVITDTGCGISAAFLPYVFERFRQANSTPTRIGGGLGLGLAIVRHLVELHQGTVEAASLGEGQGATFTVLLPIAVFPDDSRSTQADHSNEDELCDRSAQLDGVWILLVEDEADMREVITLVLNRHRARVTSVSSAGEAFTVITEASRTPDVLVCDIGLPDEDGYTLMRRVRAWEAVRGVQIPAAALTAYARDEERTQAFLAGFQIHIPKPFQPIDLVNALCTLCNSEGNANLVGQVERSEVP